MGYSAHPFAVDIEKVKAAFGSKDGILLNKTKDTDAYGTYADQFDEGEYDKCLEDITFNCVAPDECTGNVFDQTNKFLTEKGFETYAQSW